MNMKKILAAVSATAVAATMAVSASASTTIKIDSPVSDEWQSCFPDNDYIDAHSLTKDKELSVTVNFEWTEKGTEASFCAFSACMIDSSGWVSLFNVKNGYDTDITGITCKDDLTQDEETGNMVDADGNVYNVAYQNDGFIQMYSTDVTSVSFTLSANVVNEIIAACEANVVDDEGSTYGGILFQVGNNGVTITSIELSQDGVSLASTYDPNAAEDDKKDDPADDKKDDTADDKKDDPADDKKDDGKKDDTSTKNPTTGATAGLALAGLALAGAAIVATKKHD